MGALEHAMNWISFGGGFLIGLLVGGIAAMIMLLSTAHRWLGDLKYIKLVEEEREAAVKMLGKVRLARGKESTDEAS